MGARRSRQSEALELAEQLVGEIELSTLAPTDIARKASRLARLLDDAEAMDWLKCETAGYPTPLDARATRFALRSHRRGPVGDDESPQYWTATLGQMQAIIDSARVQLAVASAKPFERSQSHKLISDLQPVIDRVVGSIHDYVAERYQELRFGSAVESAFEVVRRDVDFAIGELVPDALPMLSAAFENATSTNPEHWANAAGTCRRLLKAVADELRPPGPAVDGREMGDGNYINRLVDWIVARSESETATKIITTDLAYLGERLDAADAAGQKGAHASVDRFDASRFIASTYLILGDVLRLSQGEQPAGTEEK